MISSLDVPGWVKATPTTERLVLPHGRVFNQDDPDLSTFGLADSLAESDYPPATSDDIKDLFPELEGLLELNPEDFSFNLQNKVDEVCQPQSPSPYGSEVELSPTEPINGMEHFFDSYMDISDLLSSITNEEVSPTLAETVPSEAAELTENDIPILTSTIVDTEAGSSLISNIGSPNADQNVCRKRHFTSSSTTTDDEIDEGDSNYFKYRKRRDKNNIASRRSRENRKLKEKDMEEKAEFLVTENERLKKKIEEMTRLATEMRARLVESIAKK
ncbi:thyrotroph embryonic factor-like [Anneissia japonica]|uniref:thyrotroph embryonic factor-like n=1 Tax=Anneissia japonica TaxID=1529436 RepID=UPI0014255BF7|nr:thyrotroph embryonic factor-like [Anneissia japonica]